MIGSLEKSFYNKLGFFEKGSIYLWEFLSGEEQRESILSTIVSSDFLDFCSIITQKKVKDKVIKTAF